MDDFLKRLVVAYLGFTAALWAVSFCMILNGSAYPRNPAWGIVTGLRFYFSLPIVLLLAVAAVVGLSWAVLAVKDYRQKAVEARMWAEEERLEAEERKQRAERQLLVAEAMRQRAEKDKLLAPQYEAERLARQEEEAAESKQREEERQRLIIIERQMRSARTAAERALDDF